MCSGSHQAQVDTFPSSVHTILEGVSKCNPAVPIRPCILKVELRLHIHVTNVERLRCTPLFSNLPKFGSTLYARYLQPVLISTYGYGRTKMACHIIRGSLIEYRQIRARVNIARSQLELILNKVNVAGLKREKTGVTRLNISLVGSVVRVLLTNHNA